MRAARLLFFPHFSLGERLAKAIGYFSNKGRNKCHKSGWVFFLSLGTSTSQVRHSSSSDSSFSTYSSSSSPEDSSSSSLSSFSICSWSAATSRFKSSILEPLLRIHSRLSSS